MPAPSPRIMPRRSFEKGRHTSGEITRSASQPFKPIKDIEASAPPAIATSISPRRIIPKAVPIE